MSAADTKSHPTQLDYDTVMNWPFESLTESYNRSDCIAYALGIAAGGNPAIASEETQYIRNDDTLKALPMMSIVLNEGSMWTMDPATGIDWRKTLHAEESITIHKPIASAATLTANYHVEEVYDRGHGKGAKPRARPVTTGYGVTVYHFCVGARGVRDSWCCAFNSCC